MALMGVFVLLCALGVGGVGMVVAVAMFVNHRTKPLKAELAQLLSENRDLDQRMNAIEEQLADVTLALDDASRVLPTDNSAVR